MALAEKLLAAEFNRADGAIVDHHTYVLLGDGCLMEGISHEACALAGTWQLGKLIALYDDNGISIDGHVEGWFTDDSAARFRAYGWQVIGPIDGHDVDAVDRAIADAKANTTQPSFILCRTVIGKGAPTREGTAKAHGEALGAEELAATRKALGWTYGPFEIPADIYAAWDARASGAARQATWDAAFARYTEANPDAAREFLRRIAGELPAGFAELAADLIAQTNTKAETVATRKASQLAIEAFAPAIPQMLGGSADLTHSNLTLWKGAPLLLGAGTGRHISLWRPRIRHGSHHERHRIARRLHSVRRYVPHFQRLQPQRDPHGSADEPARDPRLHARFDRPRRRRSDAPVGGNRSRACG